jgi:phosphohistidine phosphatase
MPATGVNVAKIDRVTGLIPVLDDGTVCMELIFWRHAEAADAVPGESDLARALTAKGHKQAEKMAAWLNPRLPAETRVLVSPALRTRQTVAPLACDYLLEAAIAPEASPEALLDAVGWPRADGVRLIVGHQPTLGLVIAHLLGVPGPLSVRKGAIWWLKSRHRETGNAWVLKAALTPDML